MSHPLRSLFLDMDSYFASVEQHLQPRLRGRPVGVAPMLVESTCCIAASYEAKAFGVKTGTRVSDARILCPGIEIVEARPPLYVDVHHRIIEIVESCIHVDHVLSIDEMVCWLPLNRRTQVHLEDIVASIKTKLAKEFSPAIQCSIGVASNGWLAKVASKMRKPNGFLIIEAETLPEALYELELIDLHGIGKNMELRLHSKGIHTVEQLCAAPKGVLRGIWNGIQGERLWHKLRGDVLDDYDANPQKRSIGHGHVISPELRHPDKALAVVHRLTQKAALRCRHHGLRAGGLDLSLRFVNRNIPSWTGSLIFPATADSLFLARLVRTLWRERPCQTTFIQRANIVLHHLIAEAQFTPSLFDQESGAKSNSLNQAMDSITARFGKEALYLGGAHGAMDSARPKIAFHHIPDVKLEG